jgi:predicted RND superfamily exporter protein/CRP-like cAMP-binding protein
LNHLLSFSPRHPWFVLIFLVAATAVSALQLEHLSLRIRTEAMMSGKAEPRRIYDDVIERFGSDNTTVVLISDPALFTPEKLRAVKAGVGALDALSFVDSTDSLFSVPEFRNDEGFISTTPYLEAMPQTVEEAQAVAERALDNPLLVGNLISSDGKTMAINVNLVSLGKRAVTDDQATEAIQAVVGDLSERIETVFQMGAPYVRQNITENIRADQWRIVPLAILLLVVTVSVMMRNLHGALIPMVTAMLSIVWTLGLMAALDVPLNVLTTVIPALLIVIGSTEDIHMLAEYQAGVRSGLVRLAAVNTMSNRLSTAVLLTFLTTYVGFLSITVNDITLLRQFGFFASTGLFFNFVITILLVPLYLRYLGPRPGRHTPIASPRFRRAAVVLVDVLTRHRTPVLWSLLPIALIFAAGARLLTVDNDPLAYFRADSPVVERANELAERLAGMDSFSIVLRSGIEGTFQKLRYLEEVEKLQKFVDETGLFDKSISLVDFIEVVNRVMDDEVDDLELPYRDDVVAEYMLFMSEDTIGGFVTEDSSETRILVRHHISSSEELSAAVRKIEKYVAEEIDPALVVHVTGESVLTAQAADSMASSQAKSLMLMLVAILFLVSLLFVNLKAGMLALVPNLVPIVVLFGVMGYAGIPIDTSTAMVAVIALGISIDDTLHFMARYHDNTRRYQEEHRALIATVQDESKPIIATSVALGLGFAALSVSHFPPVVYFGLLTAMVMILALVATFVLAPVLLSTISLVTLWDILSLRLKDAVCEQCSLFANMRTGQIKRVVLVGDVRQFPPGHVIMRQGEVGDEMFVMLDGVAEVWRHYRDGSSQRLSMISTGHLFGEVALMGHSTRTADVVATEPITVLALNWKGLDRVGRYFPHIAAKLFRNISAILAGRVATIEERQSVLMTPSSGAMSMSLFEFEVKLALERAHRHREPVSLVLFCLQPYLKPEDGTEIEPDHDLQTELASIVGRYTRTIDMFCRTPEGMLCLLLNRTPGDQAHEVAARVRAAIDQELGLTTEDTCLAAGVCEITDIEDPEEALRMVREAVEQAKKTRGIVQV